MTSPIAFRDARPEDAERILSLVTSAELPSSDLSIGRQEFIVAVQDGRVVACAGLEPFGEAGLFRSFAVEPALRSGGLGAALCTRLLARAAMRGMRDAYLLTITAERFFLRHGFARLDRNAVPAAVAASPEFRTLCPASAVCMHRRVVAPELQR